MPKSIAEIERLKVNAQNQNILMGRFIKELPTKETTSYYRNAQRGLKPNLIGNANNNWQQHFDIVQPTGEVDYSRYNKANS